MSSSNRGCLHLKYFLILGWSTLVRQSFLYNQWPVDQYVLHATPKGITCTPLGPKSVSSNFLQRASLFLGRLIVRSIIERYSYDPCLQVNIFPVNVMQFGQNEKKSLQFKLVNVNEQAGAELCQAQNKQGQLPEAVLNRFWVVGGW